MIQCIHKSNAYVFILYLIIVLAVFGNVVFNEFVYDDDYLIAKNEFIRGFENIPKMFTKDVTDITPIGKASGYYRPVAMVFLTLNYNIWGLNSKGWHLSNIIIHLLNTFLVFLVLCEITKNREISLLSGLVFAVHPIHVESVAPVYNYMGMLAAFFGLCSFLAYLKSTKQNKRGFFILSVALFIAAIFTKEEIFLLPAVFVLYDYYFILKFDFKKVLEKCKRYMWFVAAGALYVLMRVIFIEKGAALGFWNLNLSFNILPAANRFWHYVTIAKVFFYYAGLLVFPVNLNAFHVITPAYSFLEPHTIATIVFLSGLIWFAVYYRKRLPLISFFISMFFVSTAMISNLIPIGGLFAERFMYFPSMAYCALFGAIFWNIYKSSFVRNRKLDNVVILIGIFILLLYATKAVARNYVWRTDISLWEDTVNKSKKVSAPRLNLAEAYYKNRLYEDAIREYQLALKFPTPSRPFIHNKVGKIYGMNKMYDKALEEFKKAIGFYSDAPEFYYNIGITYFHKDDISNAAFYFKEAIKKDIKYPWGYYGMGLVYEKKNNNAKAREMFKKALELDPKFLLAQKALQGNN